MVKYKFIDWTLPATLFKLGVLEVITWFKYTAKVSGQKFPENDIPPVTGPTVLKKIRRSRQQMFYKIAVLKILKGLQGETALESFFSKIAHIEKLLVI